MLLDEKAASLDDIFCFGLIQADGLNIENQSVDTQCIDSCRGIRNRVELARGFVDRHIRCLCRQNHRDQ